MSSKNMERRLEEAKKRADKARLHRDKMITRQQEQHFRPWWKIRPTKTALAETDRKTAHAEKLFSEAQGMVERLEDEAAGIARSSGK